WPDAGATNGTAGKALSRMARLERALHPDGGAPQVPRTRQRLLVARVAIAGGAEGVQENLRGGPARPRARVRQDDALQIHSRPRRREHRAGHSGPEADLAHESAERFGHTAARAG